MTGSPTVYTVDSTGTSGTGSGNRGDLVYVTNQANSDTNLAGTLIAFDPAVFNSSSPQTINLTSSLSLSQPSGPEVIQGPGANVLTVSDASNPVGSIFGLVGNSLGSTTASLSGLTISGGVRLHRRAVSATASSIP